MIKVLFVCLGNICRSPMGEAIFRGMLMKENLQAQIQVASAATSSWEAGSTPHTGTKNILKAHDISYEGIFSTQIGEADFCEYDYILAMDQSNIDNLLKVAPKGTEDKIHLLLSLVPQIGYSEVPDPYYTTNFDLTYQLVTAGCEAWLKKIQQRPNEK